MLREPTHAATADLFPESYLTQQHTPYLSVVSSKSFAAQAVVLSYVSMEAAQCVALCEKRRQLPILLAQDKGQSRAWMCVELRRRLASGVMQCRLRCIWVTEMINDIHPISAIYSLAPCGAAFLEMCGVIVVSRYGSWLHSRWLSHTIINHDRALSCRTQ